MAEERQIFRVGNHHATYCGNPPHVDGEISKRYHNSFHDEYREQAIFVYEYEVKEGTLQLGNAGWEMAYTVVDVEVPELILGSSEALWLYNCWNSPLSRSTLIKTSGEQTRSVV
jgi:hypothetical protein